MSDLGLGKLITTEQRRDAIHVAVAPVIAGEALHPGQHVGWADENHERVKTHGAPFGIVDPFFVGEIKEGDKFWLFLYPNTVTSLRHEWTHPAFDIAKRTGFFISIEDSKKWLESFADRSGESYDKIIEVATRDCR